MFSKFSEEAQKSLLLAKDEMMKLNHPYVGSEHLLLAILSNKNTSVSKTLLEYNVTYNTFYNEIIKIMGLGKKSTQWYLYTPLLKKIIQNAIFDCKEKKEKEVTIEQLFISMLEEGEGVAIRLLIGMGVDLDNLYEEFSNKYIIKRSKKEKKLIINDFSVNFNKRVIAGEVDPVINRDEEVNRLIEVLSRRIKNNPLLIGEAGVGKTAIVEELSRRIVEGRVPDSLQDKKILSISVASLVSGTKYRGEFEERINKIIKEVETEGNIILFIDEMHTIVGAGGAEGAIDASNILKPSLARGLIKIIGATTNEEYKKYIEKDKALDRRFQKVYILEPDKEKTKRMMLSLKPLYESYHGVIIKEKVIDYIIDLTDRYIQNRKNPDKSIDIMDEVCAKASLYSYTENSDIIQKKNLIKQIIKEKNKAVKKQEFKKAMKLKKEQSRLETELNNIELKKQKKKSIIISKKMVSEIIEAKTKIPIFDINTFNTSKIKKLECSLKKEIIGQDEVIDTILNYTKKIYSGFRKNKTYSFLFVGPTGVGKTLFVKKYAEELYGKNGFIRVDMSEYKEESSISKIIGAAPGYVGYDDSITLVEKVRNNPYSVILLDEIEKASPNVLKVFLQILDEGYIHDSVGREVSFKNCIVFMTSNIGFGKNNLGFNKNNNLKQDLTDFLSIEFINRIDKVCEFKSLDRDSINEIINTKIANLKQKYKLYKISITKNSLEDILTKCDYQIYGARRIDKVIEEEFENRIINEVLKGNKEILSI